MAGGCAWQGCVCDGACMLGGLYMTGGMRGEGGGLCMAGGHTWQKGDMCGGGGMRGKGACVAGVFCADFPGVSREKQNSNCVREKSLFYEAVDNLAQRC